MTDPIDGVQAIGATRRSPILALPAEVPSAGGPSSLGQEGAPRRVAPAGGSGETQDSVAMAALREKMKQLTAQFSPIRVSFLVNPKSQDVQIRVIDLASGEIIREVPPGDVMTPEQPNEPR